MRLYFDIAAERRTQRIHVRRAPSAVRGRLSDRFACVRADRPGPVDERRSACDVVSEPPGYRTDGR